MAQYNGYVTVPHNTYDEFRNATLGNGYNVDYSFGNQCWDYVALLYHQYGLTLITKAGGGGACDCWNISRQANSRDPFTSLVGKTNVKRGDVLVFDANPWSSAGHICIADEDYKPSGIRTIEQNGNNPSAPVSLGSTNFNYFLGIFRNTKWDHTPPQPEPEDKKSGKKDKFPWVIGLNHWYNKR